MYESAKSVTMAKKPRPSAKEIDPVILLTPAGCMKLSAQSETHFYGYNVSTEKLEGHLKTDCSNVTNFIVPLLQDRFLRARIAWILSGQSNVKASKLLGISERSFYRYANDTLSSLDEGRKRAQK